MRAIFLAAWLLVAGPASAAGYYPIQVNEYDPATGLYYRTIQRDYAGGMLLSSKGSDPDAINLNIFDPAKNASTILFKEPQPGGLTLVLYETGWKDGRIQFNSGATPLMVLDNQGVAERAPKDQLLVGAWSPSAQETTLYVSDKRGSNIKKLATVPAVADWHLDVRNGKVRVVFQSSQGVIVESYPW